MKKKGWPRVGLIFILSISLLLLTYFKATAEEAKYIYDDLGRLHQVIDELVTSDRIPDTFTGFTIETMHAGLKGNKDPIRSGTYSAYRRYDHEPDRIELENVPGFEHIQIHITNYPTQLRGCSGVGMSRGRNFLNFSTTAFMEILEIVERDMTNIITVEVTVPDAYPF